MGYFFLHRRAVDPCCVTVDCPPVLLWLQDEMGEARNVMRTLKEERDEIRGQLDSMQVLADFCCAGGGRRRQVL